MLWNFPFSLPHLVHLNLIFPVGLSVSGQQAPATCSFECHSTDTVDFYLVLLPQVVLVGSWLPMIYFQHHSVDVQPQLSLVLSLDEDVGGNSL